jgi:poly-gamma-glutamate synthesis protein (capsule biosynthesis protein)
MVLDSLGIKRTGTFSDSADYNANNPLILNANGIKIALLNYTYGTNGLPFQYPAMVNLIDEQKVMKDITYTKSLLPDFILVYFHWGNEYQSYPTRQQVELANACRDMGVDAVIGSHPHVLQPMEYFSTSDSTGPSHLTVYSLGNYVSNQRDRFKDGGAMVSFNLLKTWNRREITEPRYHLTWVHTPYENNKKQYYILPVNQPGLDTILDSQAAEKMSIFINDSRQLLNQGSFAIPEADIK